MKNIPLTVLWFGGGQDSTALLYLYAYDAEFRRNFTAGSKFIAVMADTGDEYPETYLHVRRVQEFCRVQGVEFYFLTPDLGFHGATWQSLAGQMERNDNIFSVALPKSCTDNLKIKVCYRFLEDYLRLEYGFLSEGKRVFYEYAERFGKLTSLIGFAKGEESRCASTAQLDLFPDTLKDYRPVWMRKNVQHRYPLVELRYDRADCQGLISKYGHSVPIPSNCMMCPFQNEAEIVYLERFHPEKYAYWVEREQAKRLKNAEKARNLGVKGEKTLPEFLDKAKEKYADWSDEQLREYRNSHGHCVKSKY